MSAPTPKNKIDPAKLTRTNFPNGLTPEQLMVQVESPAGSDPMMVEHHEFAMKYPEMIDRSVVEFMSLIYSKTIRKGHRWPVAIDGAGKLFTIEHVADNRGWSLDWAMRVFNEAIRCGFVRRGTGKRYDFPPTAIVLLGRVKPKKTEQVTDTNELVGTECTLRKLRTLLSEKEFAQFERLDPDARERYAAVELAEAEVDKRIMADAAWQARQAVEQRQHTRRVEFGIQPDAPAKKRRTQSPIVQLTFVTESALEERSVHSEAVNGTHTPTNGSVQSGASLYGFPSGYFPSEEASSSSEVSTTTEEATTSTTEPGFDPTLPLTETLFHQELSNTFVDDGKPAPTRKQSVQAFRRLERGSHGYYIEDLRKRMADVRGPGVLQTDVPIFAETWPRRRAKLAAEWKQRQEFQEKRARQQADQENEQAAERRRQEQLRAAAAQFGTLTPNERAPFLASATAELRSQERWHRMGQDMRDREAEELAAQLFGMSRRDADAADAASA